MGIAYNSTDGHVYVTDDQNRIYRNPFQKGRRFGDPVASAMTSFDGRYTDPEGITCDPATGELLVTCRGVDNGAFPERNSLAAGSPAIDVGLDQVTWDGRTWSLAAPAEYSGCHPDVGAVEWWVSGSR